MKKSTSGISLVALVVTIIVLIILTAAVIVTFMEGGIIEKAKEAVFKSDIRIYQEILAVKNAEKQIELATGNGEGGLLNADTLEKIQELIPEFKEEYKDLVEIQNGEIVLGSRSEEPYSTWLLDLGIGEKVILPIIHNGIIPEGGKYYVKVPRNEVVDMYGSDVEIYALSNYTGAEAEYTAGDEFPIPQIGDVYVYGDYEYRYNMYYSFDNIYPQMNSWGERSDLNGWGVRVLDNTKSSYGTILTTINNKNIVSADSIFANCANLIESPTLPSYVESMAYSYNNCISLEVAPSIPSGVTSMLLTFFSCTSLEVAPEIPYGVTNMMQTFCECTALKVAPEIPSSVTALPITFGNCTSLVQAPVIPESIVDMNNAFANCTSLTGTIEINANLNINDEMSYSAALEGTKITWITGSISDELKQKIAEVNGITLVKPIETIDGGDVSKTGVYYKGVVNNEFGNYSEPSIKYINGAFPETVEKGDIYVEGDYEYRYSMHNESIEWGDYNTFDGWGVAVIDKTKSTYGEILSQIAGKDVISLKNCFANSSIVTAPVINSGIKDLTQTFTGCPNLTGNIEINAEPESYSLMFIDIVKPVTLSGTSSKLNEMAATSVTWNETTFEFVPNGNVTVANN
ncbi:MAG: hypothetical protein E7311_06195 [Clostridiales bacterium]|nr:hypothetical protein [Clostridiales bacterium]